ncbi:acetyltransferase (GNAT) family protein [Haloactinospora alba]|uniref:Acetyltransferase (GNAT) family protein n=1 Tax=Haloactinospora alba TaxID=405555 RepID=A0A543NGR2_9ACTN|nr:GNAT family N-acetyltransferase [Haloactinospora alba]TQN30984.1 acetyltransferase (GNAT) family protein [Haloactinospora alba]
MIAEHAVPTSVELLRLDADSPRTAEVRRKVVGLRLAPGQQRFSGEAAHTLPRADTDPNRVPFAVLYRQTPVGFGIIDQRGILDEITAAPAEAVLLRAFYLDPEWQGRGIGRTACLALDPLVRSVRPEANEVVLTVNEANPAAVRAYRSGGFTATGERYLGGDAGPQLVMRRPVPYEGGAGDG